MKRLATLFFTLLFSALLTPEASACAACFGRSDSPLADGMNAGIFTLLVIIVGVLAGVAAFLIHLIRRANQPAAASGPASVSETLHCD